MLAAIVERRRQPANKRYFGTPFFKRSTEANTTNGTNAECERDSCIRTEKENVADRAMNGVGHLKQPCSAISVPEVCSTRSFDESLSFHDCTDDAMPREMRIFIAYIGLEAF